MINLKEIAFKALEQKSSIPIDLSKDILSFAESGFKEFKTQEKVASAFKKLGQRNISDNLAITGLKTTLDTGKEGPSIAILGELDGLPVPGHPFENPQSGVAHACGHHIQIGSMLSTLIAIKEPEVLTRLSGKITFMAVPAEEFVEIEWRNNQRKGGKIEFLGGKQEFIKLGFFDDIDISMMTHTTPRNIKFSYGGTDNGLVAKFVEFKGIASHAGASPESGINALNAANIAIAAINSQRETFKDEDHIRVHPIITKGGSVVSAVPDSVNLETFVRGASIEAIKDTSKKIDNCIKAGAMATGASVKITTLPGYLPLQNDTNLMDIYVNNLKETYSNKDLQVDGHSGGSTDMGDVSHIMPAIHPYVGGSEGISNHSADMVTKDYNLAVIESGKMMASTIIDLLMDDGKKAKEVLENFTPILSKKEYLELLRELSSEVFYESSHNIT